MSLTRTCQLAVVCVACHRSTDPKPEAAAAPVMATATAATTASVLLGADSRLPRIFERRGDTQRVVAGALRAEVTRDGVTLARDRFVHEIIAAVPVRDGWVFAALDGAVARADTFTGELVPLGQLPERRASSQEGPAITSCGRLALTTADPHASLWTTDGTTPIAPLASTPSGIVESAAFVDAEHGMIVAAGGELFHTGDAGKTFQRIDLGTEAAAAVSCVDGSLRVETSAAILAFDRDGKPSGSGPPPAAPVQYGSIELRARLLAAALRRDPDGLAARFGGLITSDGRALVPVGATLRAVATASDAELAQAVAHDRPCTAAPWGRSLALVCNAGVHRVDPGTLHATAVWQPPPPDDMRGPAVSYERREPPPQLDAATAVFSDDGRHAASGCDVQWLDGYRRLDSLCVLLPDGTIAKRRRGTDELLGMRGDAYFVLRHGSQPRILELAAATGDERRSIEVTRPASAPNLVSEALVLATDGTVSVTAFGITSTSPWRQETHVVRVDVDDGSVTPVPLPDGATRGAFVDAERGVAVGRDLSRLWETGDGGAHWQPLAVDVTGTIAARTSVHEPGTPGWRVACTGTRCTIDDLVAVRFDAPSVPAGERALASATPIVDRVWTRSAPRFSCAQHGTRTAPVLENPDDFLLDALGRSRYQKTSVDLTLSVSRTRWRLDWHGRDARGVYPNRSASGPMPPPGDDLSEYQLKRATREGVVIYHRGDDDQLVWAPAGARPVAIRDPSLDEYGSVSDYLALPDGRLAIAVENFTPQAYENAARYTRLLVVDRGGRVLARRTFHHESNHPGIAYIDGTFGLQWIEDDPALPRWFFPITPTEPKRALPPFDLAATPICKAVSATEVSTFVLNEQLGRSVQAMYSPDVWRVYIDERARCVQAIELDDGERSMDDAGQVFAVAHRDGELQVDYYAGNVYRSSWLDVRCKAD